MKRILSSLSFSLLFTIAMAAHAQTGGTIAAASCNLSDVQSAFNSVTANTTLVTIPAGTCSWTGLLNWTVPAGNTNLTIQGQTQVNCSGTPGTSSYSCTAQDNTVIVDNSATMYPSPLTINLGGASTVFRITGITFEGGGSAVSKANGIIQFNGPSDNFRADHIHINTNTYSFSGETGARFFGEMEGVIDHVICDMNGVANCLIMSNPIGDTIGYGDGTWASPTNFGSSSFMFIEDSQMNGGMIEDCDTAGKFVLRYSSILNGTASSANIRTHGTKTPAGRGRGCRAYEAYHNYINVSSGTNNAAISSAGGPSLVWGNTLGGGYSNFAGVEAPRNDSEETEVLAPTGWGPCGSNDLPAGVTTGWDGDNPTSSGWPCLDGVGRGQGQQALNGQNFPLALNSSTGTIAWPEEYLEPVYYFGNSIPGGVNEMEILDKSTELNRDVYIENPSFNGSSGTGTGPLASRPSNCTPGPGGTYGASPTGSYGVAYFATDANGGRGELYVCTATNTWTGIYEPYTYPHPLESGSTNPTPPPPTDLSGTLVQ